MSRGSSSVPSSEKGVYPCSSSYRSTPSAHQSTGAPWGMCEIISGARYSGVPQRVVERSEAEVVSPKSMSRTRPSASMTTFSGFRSRYTRPTS